MRWLWFTLVLGVAATGCNSSNGSACRSAGGTCTFGGGMCVQQAPASEQDCPANGGPGGELCCAVLMQPPPLDGGIDSSTAACTSAGGTCVIGPGITCAKQAPTNAQDCDPSGNPGGAICCLVFDDAGPAPQDSGIDSGG